MLTAIALGFLLGLRHASDPDHVIAISTIVSRFRRPGVASWIGAAWGLGHSVTIVAVGAGIVALRLAVPLRVALSMELAVGVVLVTLGLSNLVAMRGPLAHAPHDPDAFLPRERGFGGSLRRAFLVGLVHGLAGSAAVALLALAAVPTAAAAIAYLAVFSLGTVGGMVAISLGLGFPVAWASGFPGARRFIVAGSGALSIAFGAWLVYDIAFVQGLL